MMSHELNNHQLFVLLYNHKTYFELNYFHKRDTIGYKFIESYLMGQITKKEMEDKIVIKTNQFSRRQKKWFEKENIDLIIEMDNIDKKQLP